MTDPAQLSESDFVDLLTEHANQLRKIGPEPLLVACATNKFNDAFDDDQWSAVQIGRAYWEQSLHFHHSPPDKVEAAFYVSNASAFAAGREILASLERRHWRQAGREQFSRHPDCDHWREDLIYALIIQHDQAWLWVGLASGASKNLLYACHSSGLVLAGSDEHRLDQSIGAPQLLFPAPFNQASLPFLSPSAQAQFRPRIIDENASHELARLVYRLVDQLRQVTAAPVMFWLEPCSRRLSMDPENASVFSKIIEHVDLIRLRWFFEQASGLDTFGHVSMGAAYGGPHEVVFTLIDSSVTIVFEIFVFSLDRTKGLVFEGYCRERYGQFADHLQLARADPGVFERVAAP